MRSIPPRLLLSALALTAPAHAEEACEAQIEKLRFEDEVSCFLEPANRSGLGALKFIPLDDDTRSFLSLGGELRQRYEYTDDPLFGEDPQDETGVWLQRYTFHGDLHLGEHVRFFAQLLSALENGREGGPSPVDENQLVLQNGFVDLSMHPMPSARTTLRVGRQELQYGSGRLVDVREGPNVRRTFDAARGLLAVPAWRLEGVFARPRLSQEGVFDDQPDHDQALFGVYAAGRTDLLPAGEVDLYYLGFRDDSGTFVQGTAEERRHSFGLRLWGAERGWDWNWEAVYQFGSFGDGDIRAWTVASETGFTFTTWPWRPRLALNANVASGDDDPTDPDLGTFNPLFPRGNYFSEAAVLGPRNFFNIHPFLTVSPSSTWSLTADVNVFWRLETEDGVYSPSGRVIRGPAGSDDRFVGSAFSLNSEHQLANNLIFAAIYTQFFPGDFIRATGASDDIDFFEITLQFKF